MRRPAPISRKRERPDGRLPVFRSKGAAAGIALAFEETPKGALRPP